MPFFLPISLLPENWPYGQLQPTLLVCHEKVQSDGKWADTTSWPAFVIDT